MKIITMTELRAEPGERFIDIRRDHQTFLVTIRGKPIAKLGPVDETIVIGRDGTIRGERPLTMGLALKGYY